jgi:hypothetical protein
MCSVRFDRPVTTPALMASSQTPTTLVAAMASALSTTLPLAPPTRHRSIATRVYAVSPFSTLMCITATAQRHAWPTRLHRSRHAPIPHRLVMVWRHTITGGRGSMVTTAGTSSLRVCKALAAAQSTALLMSTLAPAPLVTQQRFVSICSDAFVITLVLVSIV